MLHNILVLHFLIRPSVGNGAVTNHSDIPTKIFGCFQKDNMIKFFYSKKEKSIIKLNSLIFKETNMKKKSETEQATVYISDLG